MEPAWVNRLYFGNNLDILRRYIADESIDLVYLDPPFNSNASYNVLFRERNGTDSAAQIKAFDDFWHWDREAAATYDELTTGVRGKVGDLIEALYRFLGPNDMMAYLTMMAIRLLELRRKLKPTGSIYLHCDPTASHYLKLAMDAVFGAGQFRNEIVWKRSHPHGNVSRAYGAIHDVILFYSRNDRYAWTQPHKPYVLANGEIDPELREALLAQYSHVEEGTGRRFQATSLLNPNPNRPNLTYAFHGHTKVWRWTRERMEQAEREGRLYFPRGGDGIPREKRYVDEQEGLPLQDIWTDIPLVGPTAPERLGYPTQKPEALLERIIQASSEEGDLVLDPFCGCGTTVAVAERLHRRWIGIDITHLAISLMRSRLRDTFANDISDYRVMGEPEDLESARALAEENRHQFEYWALSLVKARPEGEPRRGADRGIDGNLYFHDDDSGKAKRCVIQVKSGKVQAAIVHALKGVLEREKAEIAALITLEEPTEPMRREALEAGFYKAHALIEPVPRVQILTIAELLHDKKLELPVAHANATFKRAPRRQKARRMTKAGD